MPPETDAVKAVLTKPSPSVSALGGRLQLAPAEVAALTQQGFVSSERRGPNSLVYKLRYRLQGRQRVRYLGTCALTARAIEQELQQLQRTRHERRQLLQLHALMRRQLKAGKAALRPLLQSAGFAFHGFAVRRKRSVP